MTYYKVWMFKRQFQQSLQSNLLMTEKKLSFKFRILKKKTIFQLVWSDSLSEYKGFSAKASSEPANNLVFLRNIPS